ncbi:MAG: integration host factor subunit beta [Nitrospiraceae bacterium]|nr:integration host factor subunit beta [Nitrospiraceae bacterium]
MNKSDLIECLANEIDLPFRLAEFVVDDFFDAMTNALIQNEGVQIRGFGSFTIREYEPYTGRNPKTGEKIAVSPKKLPFFKVGKELRERVNK